MGTKVLVLFETISILIIKSLEEGLLKVVLCSIKNIAKIELFPLQYKTDKTFISYLCSDILRFKRRSV